MRDRISKILSNCILCLTVILILITVLAGCSSKDDKITQKMEEEAGELNSQVDNEDTQGATREIVDMAGRTVVISEQIDKVYCAVPTAESMIYSLAPDKLVGWVNTPSEAVKEYLTDEVKELPTLGGWMGEKVTASLEAIIEIQPDLIIYMTNFGYYGDVSGIITAADNMAKQTNLPVVVLDSALNKIVESYTMAGDWLGLKDRAQFLADECEEIFANTAEMVNKIPEDKLKKVYYAEGTDALQTDPLNGHTEAIEFVRGINVADIEGKAGMGMSKVSLEQVLSWNPDTIIVSGGGEDVADKILTNSSWSKINAIKNGEVYVIPALPFNWFDRPPSMTRVLGVQWTAKILYPEYVDIDIQQTVKDFYSTFFQYELSDEQIAHLMEKAI